VKSPSLLLGLRLAKALNVDPYHLALGEDASTADQILNEIEHLTVALTDLAARVTALETEIA
jgi:hypothetical protein